MEHPDVAKALNSLAALLRESRRLDEAGALYNRALAITEAHFGMNHKAVGHALNGLVLWLRDSGRLEEAIPLTRRMLDIEIQHLGEDDPEVATARGTLGNMLVQLYQLDEAESLHRRALEVVEKCYGKDHHRVSVVLNNLACCLEAAKRHEEAVPIAERALGILIISYPDGHHKIKDALNNLLIIVKAIELPARSITLMQKVLSEYEQILSEDKIALALQHEELARSLIISKRSGEAIPQLQKALALREQIPGGGPLLGVALNNLGMLLKNVNQLDQAEGLIRRALNVFVEVARNTGTSHPTIQTSIKVYRQILASQGRSELEIRSTLQEIVPDYDPT